MRACEVIAINGAVCDNSPGGIIRAAIAKLADIGSITYTADKITAVAMLIGKHFAEWAFADNETANYVEAEPTRENAIIEQTVVGQFYSVTADGIKAGDGVNQCCEPMIAFLELGDGSVRAVGIERYLDSGSPVWRPSRRKLRVFVGTNTQTINNRPFTSVTMNSGALYLSSFTGPSLDLNAILAL